MNENLSFLVAMEALAAVQGIEFRAPLRTSRGLDVFASIIRGEVEPLGDDRVLSSDVEAVARLVLDGRLVPGCSPELERECR